MDHLSLTDLRLYFTPLTESIYRTVFLSSNFILSPILSGKCAFYQACQSQLKTKPDVSVPAVIRDTDTNENTEFDIEIIITKKEEKWDQLDPNGAPAMIFCINKASYYLVDHTDIVQIDMPGTNLVDETLTPAAIISWSHLEMKLWIPVEEGILDEKPLRQLVGAIDVMNRTLATVLFSHPLLDKKSCQLNQISSSFKSAIIAGAKSDTGGDSVDGIGSSGNGNCSRNNDGNSSGKDGSYICSYEDAGEGPGNRCSTNAGAAPYTNELFQAPFAALTSSPSLSQPTQPSSSSLLPPSVLVPAPTTMFSPAPTLTGQTSYLLTLPVQDEPCAAKGLPVNAGKRGTLPLPSERKTEPLFQEKQQEKQRHTVEERARERQMKNKEGKEFCGIQENDEQEEKSSVTIEERRLTHPSSSSYCDRNTNSSGVCSCSGSSSSHSTSEASSYRTGLAQDGSIPFISNYLQRKVNAATEFLHTADLLVSSDSGDVQWGMEDEIAASIFNCQNGSLDRDRHRAALPHTQAQAPIPPDFSKPTPTPTSGLQSAPPSQDIYSDFLQSYHNSMVSSTPEEEEVAVLFTDELASREAQLKHCLQRLCSRGNESVTSASTSASCSLSLCVSLTQSPAGTEHGDESTEKRSRRDSTETQMGDGDGEEGGEAGQGFPDSDCEEHCEGQGQGGKDCAALSRDCISNDSISSGKQVYNRKRQRSQISGNANVKKFAAFGDADDTGANVGAIVYNGVDVDIGDVGVGVQAGEGESFGSLRDREDSQQVNSRGSSHRSDKPTHHRNHSGGDNSHKRSNPTGVATPFLVVDVMHDITRQLAHIQELLENQQLFHMLPRLRCVPETDGGNDREEAGTKTKGQTV